MGNANDGMNLKNKLINTHMKNLTLFCLIIFFIINCAIVNAQNYKFLIGGTFGFGYSSDKPKESSSLKGDSKTIIISTAPIFGYSLTNNIMIGIALEYYLNNTYMNEQVYDYIKQTDFLLSPFLRYYINSPFFVHG